jgi:hypothetical protein
VVESLVGGLEEKVLDQQGKLAFPPPCLDKVSWVILAGQPWELPALGKYLKMTRRKSLVPATISMQLLRKLHNNSREAILKQNQMQQE